jgi:hypothetical protein
MNYNETTSSERQKEKRRKRHHTSLIDATISIRIWSIGVGRTYGGVGCAIRGGFSPALPPNNGMNPT